MRKYADDEKVCVTCEYCDEFQEKTWCNNKRGARYGDTHYHIADTGCNEWKPCKVYKEECKVVQEKKKPSYGNGYVSNMWDEWQKKAYKKGLYNEKG